MILGIDIRPADRRPLALAFLVLATITAGHAVLETARDTLFLTHLPATTLPWAYIGIAVVSALLARFVRPSRGNADRRWGLIALLGGTAAITVFFWGWAGRSERWIPGTLYLWTGIVATTLLPRFWLVLGDRVSPAQAKRLYAVVGAAALVGAALGSLLASFLLGWMSARGLVLVSAAIFVVAAGLVPLLGKPTAPAVETRATKGKRAVRRLGTRAYVNRLVIVSLVGAATIAVVDYVFKSAVAATVPKEELGRFFATTYAAVNGIALVVQFVLAPALLRYLGAVSSLVVLPILLGGAAVAFLFSGRLGPILAAKVADGALRNSLTRASTELLLLPLPAAQRERTKPLTDALGTRGGQGLASLLILGMVWAGAGLTAVAVAAPILALGWAAVAVSLRPAYLGLFRAALTAGRLRDARLPTDAHSVETLVASLSSPDDSEVLAAMELLASSGRTALIPTTMIYHPATPVMRRALHHLAAEPGRRDLPRAAARLLRHPDAEVRAASLAMRALHGALGELQAALADSNPLVQVTAAVLILRQRPDDEAAWTRFHEIAASGSAEAQTDLARAVADHGDATIQRRFLERAKPCTPAVMREVARAATALPDAAWLPLLMPMLAHREPRTEARQALVASGAVTLEALDRAFDDEATPLSVRRHLPRTISLFASQAAAAVLTRRLECEPEGTIRFKILRALGRMRADNPDLQIDEAPLNAYAEETLARAFEVLAWRVALGEAPVPAHVPLVALLTEKGRHACERLFRILGVLYPREQLRAVYYGLLRGDPRRRDAGTEVLGQILEGRLRERVLLLVDELDDVERLSRAGLPVPAADEALVMMKGDHSVGLQALVAHAAPGGDGMKALALFALLAAACGSGLRRFPLREPMWSDTDLLPRSVGCRPNPEAGVSRPGHLLCRPSEYDSYYYWDAADNMLFRPMVTFFKFEPGREAVNVNSFDEVPDSSWFTNRVGHGRPVDAAPLCADDALDTEQAEPGTWLIDQGKGNGANPGFRVKLADGRKYLLKTDIYEQPERSSATAAIVNHMAYAAGWYTSCDRVIYVSAEVFKLSPGLYTKDNQGNVTSFDQNKLDEILLSASKRDGKVRFLASRWLPGRSIGPFRYDGVKDDDPGDIIPHEQRRDLRGLRLFAAWINNFDTREANSMAIWFSKDEKDPDASPGHVIHYLMDMGDSFGSIFVDKLWQRIGHNYFLDFGYFFADLFTFGIIERPWDRAEIPQGSIFGYFRAEDFDPEAWKPGYPNPSFLAMTERDGAWAARILARFNDGAITTMVAYGDLTSTAQAAFLAEQLRLRRDLILRRYFARLSPVTDLAVEDGRLCGVDLARATGVYGAQAAFHYRARAWVGEEQTQAAARALAYPDGKICVELPRAVASAESRADDPAHYVIIELHNGQAGGALRAHLYDLGPAHGYRLVGIERDEGDSP